MSIDSRSRSRSPIGDDGEDDGSPRNRRADRWKFERSSRTSSSRGGSSNNRVYVSNIPYELKWQDLKDTFRTQVGDVTYVEMFEDDNRRPTGSALVEFDTYDLARKAVDKMNHYEVKGRELVVKEKCDAMRSRDFQFLFNPNSDRGDRGGNRHHRDSDRRSSYERPSFRREQHRNDDPSIYGNTYGLSIPFLKDLGVTGPLVNKVFVANLDYKVNSEEVAEVFKVAGTVVSSEIIKQDGKSRGFAVIEYEHPVQAVQAISMLHNQTYYDRVINVRLDRVAEKQHKSGGSSAKLPPGLKSLGMGLGMNGSAITDISNLSASHTQGNSSNFSAGNMPTLMGGGTGFDMATIPGNSNNIRPNLNPVAMLGLGGSIDQLSALSNTLGMNMGNLGNNPALGGNIGMGGNLGMGSNIGITGNLPLPNQMGGNMPNQISTNMSTMGSGVGISNIPNPNNMLGGNGGNGHLNMRSNVPNFPSNMSNFSSNRSGNSNQNGMFSNSNNERRGSSGSSSRCIVQVTNLPSDYTWQSLKDLCRNYGDIKFAEIRIKGTGLVRFSSESEARRAADVLDRQRFDGRLLDAHVL